MIGGMYLLLVESKGGIDLCLLLRRCCTRCLGGSKKEDNDEMTDTTPVAVV